MEVKYQSTKSVSFIKMRIKDKILFHDPQQLASKLLQRFSDQLDSDEEHGGFVLGLRFKSVHFISFSHSSELLHPQGRLVRKGFSSISADTSSIFHSLLQRTLASLCFCRKAPAEKTRQTRHPIKEP